MTATHERINERADPRILAVDWSGAASRSDARRRIWLAEATAETIVRIESERDRSELTEHLLDQAEQDPRLVVGLNFAFSLPQWFAARIGATDGPSVWRLVAERGEDWLRNPQPPFWRTRRPALAEPVFRRTELAVAEPGIRPKSVFQLGGAGNVGTGSLRGMPFLLRRSERFAIWPFDEPRLPLVVEVYPRLHLADGWARRLPPMPNEHARDAAATALAMASWHGDWTRLREGDRLEGGIWHPEAPLHSDP